MSQSILIVDDEKDIIEFLGYNLRNEGYEVHECRSGEAALGLVEEITPDLIILDIMMGAMNGIETCNKLRKKTKLKDTLIVFLSRINGILRRRHKHKKQIFGNIEIDFEKMELIVDGKKQTIRKKEFLLLKLLTSKPGKVFKREEILNIVWGKQVIVGDRTIDVHIKKLREKISSEKIKTIKGFGYKFEF